jgi:hypothetical protein
MSQAQSALLASLGADLVVLAHAAFIAFAVFGGLLALKVRRLWPLHLAALAWAAAIELMGWICPLTPLENRLRALAVEEGYAGGFIEHYLVPLIYPGALTRRIQICLGAALLAGNGAVYWFVWKRRRLAHRGVAGSAGGPHGAGGPIR